jgi:hypothetical protein
MKNKLLISLVFLMLFIPGCAGLNMNVNKAPVSVSTWWGTKAECIEFLNSPQAQADRWMVESIGE